MSRNKWFVASLIAASVGFAAEQSFGAARSRRPDAESAPVMAAPADDAEMPAEANDAPAPAEDEVPAPAPRRAARPAPRDPGAREEAREARRRTVNDADWFRDRSLFSNKDSNGFPSAEVHDAVIANARAATARAVYRRAESALNAAVRKANRDFQSSDELKDALAAEKAAWQSYQDSRRQALAQVVADPHYQAAITLREDLGKQLATRRASLEAQGIPATQLISMHGPENQELMSIATLRMNIAADARNMERAALEDSDELKEARQKLTAAASRISELKSNFKDSVLENEDLNRAREVLEDAKIARLTAAAYLKGSMMAADEAIDFAYWLHRYDRTVSFDPYGQYGYSVGYGSRYSGGY